MTEADYAFLCGFLEARSGLSLTADKRYLVESRLRPVWMEAGLQSLAGLARALRRSETEALGRAVVDAMTTNETSFFRDPPVFSALRTVVLPRLLARRDGVRRLRIWSAAASTGQEAYSVAMMLAEAEPALAEWQVSVLGTDIAAHAVERARTGTYSQFEVQRGLPIRSLLRHFEQTEAGWTISENLRRAVEFRVMNLLDDVSRLGRFDLILCRNLLIYLQRPTKIRLLERLAAQLAPDGYLCLGASETALGLSGTLVPDPETRCCSLRPAPILQGDRAVA